MGDGAVEIPLHFQADGVWPGGPGQEHAGVVVDGGVVGDDEGWVGDAADGGMSRWLGDAYRRSEMHCTECCEDGFDKWGHFNILSF